MNTTDKDTAALIEALQKGTIIAIGGIVYGKPIKPLAGGSKITKPLMTTTRLWYAIQEAYKQVKGIIIERIDAGGSPEWRGTFPKVNAGEQTI